MVGFFSILIGIIVVWISYKVLVKEIDKGFEAFSEKYPGINDGNTKVILDQFDKMENLVNDLNSTYYEFVSDLEGHYSVHDKELQLLEGRLNKMESELRSIKGALASEAKNREKTLTVTPPVNPGNKEQSQLLVKKDPVQEIESVPLTTSAPKFNRKLDLLNLSEQDKDALRKQIVDMRHRGLNLAQIARELDVGVGELQLFLNLNKIR